MTDINGMDELNNFIQKNTDKVILLYFGATWCGPCKKLKQDFANPKFMKNFPNMVIGHIDIDENGEISEEYNVQNLPTQIFIGLKKTENENNIEYNVVELGRIVGYDPIKLHSEYKYLLKI